MAFNFNGNTPNEILYNGLNVAKLIYNGVVVWTSSEQVLPDGYTQVEYLESTGTQYINTRYYPNNLTDVECKFMFNQLPSNAVPSVFGVRASNNSVQQFLTSVSNGVLWIVNGLNNHSIPSVRPLVNTEYILRITPQKAYWNGTEIFTMTNSVADCPNLSMLMFGRNTYSGLANQLYGKIYYLKIYEAGVLVRNFIPCKNPSNVAGMYDTVEGVFYTNAGTGTFNVGPVTSLPYGYTELEHIQGTGTQYINIGRAMYNYSELELCFSFDEIQQDCSIFGSRQSSEKNNFEIASSNNFPIYLDFGSYSTSRASYNNAAINTKYVCTISKSLRAIYDENNTLLARNTDLIYADNTTPSNARIFDTFNGFSSNKLKGKVYYCKVWENGVLVRNMIPCKNSSNVVGMYDLVNAEFYTNAGTGSFIAGEVETVNYAIRNVDDNDRGIDTLVEESIALPTVANRTVTADIDTEIAPNYAEINYTNSEENEMQEENEIQEEVEPVEEIQEENEIPEETSSIEEIQEENEENYDENQESAEPLF